MNAASEDDPPLLAAGEELGSKISLFILLIYAGDGHSHWRYGGETPTPYRDPIWAPGSADARTRISPRIHVCQSPANPDPASFTSVSSRIPPDSPHHFFYSTSLKFLILSSNFLYTLAPSRRSAMAPGVPSLRWPLSIPGRHPPRSSLRFVQPCNPPGTPWVLSSRHNQNCACATMATHR